MLFRSETRSATALTRTHHQPYPRLSRIHNGTDSLPQSDSLCVPRLRCLDQRSPGFSASAIHGHQMDLNHTMRPADTPGNSTTCLSTVAKASAVHQGQNGRATEIQESSFPRPWAGSHHSHRRVTADVGHSAWSPANSSQRGMIQQCRQLCKR